ncbi:hypothetical protein ACP4OV_030755 [Aristida adscensionis]
MASPAKNSAHSSNPALLGRAMGAYPIEDIDPSTATDLELLRVLREKYELFKTEGELRHLDAAGLTKLNPGDLPPCFLTTRLKVGEQSKMMRWGQGEFLKEVNFTAIRDTSQLRYVGAKKTHEFSMRSGTRLDTKMWRMHEYYLIDGHQQELQLGEEMVLCTMSSRRFSPELLKILHPAVKDNLVIENEKMMERRIALYKILSPVLPCDRDESLKAPHLVPEDFLEAERPLNLYEEKKERCKGGLMRVLLDRRRVETITDDQVPPGKGKGVRPSDGKSEVWQDFTKIRTEDPDVIYAACHCCDKMFKAHPKKYGTNHLRRHSNICRCKQRQLHEENKHNFLEEMEQQKHNLKDHSGKDPWHLPSCFIMEHKNKPSLDTLSGFWKEKERSFVAIREHQLNDRPVYFAVKKTLEFHQRWQDGKSAKIDWLMTMYFVLHPYNSRPGDFLLMDEIVMCKVFRKGKDVRPFRFKDFKRFLEEEEYKGELCTELEDELNKYMSSFGDRLVDEGTLSDEAPPNNCLLDEGASSDEAPPKKCPRYGASSSGKSDVWHRFNKIFTKDGILLYGVCHSCRTMLKAPVKNGTSSLRRHGANCSSKHETNPF